MAYRVVVKMGSGAFFVPTEAVQNLKLCTAAQLKLLLLAFSKGFAELSPESAAAELNMTAEDAKDNLDYWVNRGILECDGAAPKAAVPSPAPIMQPVIETVPAPAPLQAAHVKPPESKLTMKDVQRIKNEDPEVAFVLSEAERILGKTFTTSDTETVVWLLSWAGMPPEVLVTVIEYCVSIGKGNLRYIQKIALDWLDNGISTVEAAEERIHAMNETKSWCGNVKRALKIRGRELSDYEKELFESWRLLNLSCELIHFAYEKCVKQTSEFKYEYINAILLSWERKGIKTVEEAKAENKPGEEQKAPSFNLDELEQRMLLDDGVF